MIAATTENLARMLIELGAVVLVLALLARMSHRLGLSPIPLYLLAGLAIGEQHVVTFEVTRDFVDTGAEIGVVLLLLTLGLQFTADELRSGLRSGIPIGSLDIVLNFTPGFIAGLILGWGPATAVLLGGVTYISSSGIISKLLSDFDRLSNRETPVILTILVIEDLAMTVFLPVTAVLVAGQALTAGRAVTVVASFAAVALALFLALRHGHHVSRVVASRSDEVLLLSLIGLTFIVAGMAQHVGVSAAVGAFLVGIAVSNPVAERAASLVGPLRDLFAATFFFLFGLQINVDDIVPVLIPAVVLAVVTAATKIATGWWAARRVGVARRGRLRSGTALIARGEFSIVIAEVGIAAGVEARFGPLAAAYVLILAVIGPLVARLNPAVAASHTPTPSPPR